MKNLIFVIFASLIITGCCRNYQQDCFSDSTMYQEDNSVSLYANTDDIEDAWKDIVKNYQLSYSMFLSDASPCNQGEEPLRSFICKFRNDEQFRQERIKIEGNALEKFLSNDVPSFKYLLNIYNTGATSSYSAKMGINGQSWSEIEQNMARYVKYNCYDIEYSYTFERTSGKWYLIDYLDISDNICL